MTWGIGANDVANAMGTSVGSGAITVTTAIVIAAIFEFAGAAVAGGPFWAGAPASAYWRTISWQRAASSAWAWSWSGWPLKVKRPSL